MKNQRIALVSLVSLGAVALGATVWAGVGRSRATSTSTASSATRASVSAPAAVDSDGFRPSEFAGVSVRERPSRASGAGSKRASSRAWVALRPGGKLPSGGIGRFSNAPLRKGKGGTARGGDKVSGASLMHSDVAVRGVDGSISTADVPEGSAKKRAAGQGGSR